MSGLEEVGIPGSDHLREALTNCTDPLAAIEEFQVVFLLWMLSLTCMQEYSKPSATTSLLKYDKWICYEYQIILKVLIFYIALDSEWDFVTIVETSIALPGSTRSEQIGISRFNYGRITGQTATKDSNCRRFW